MEMTFPKYRKLAGSNSVYAIEGTHHVTEWQPMGSEGWIVHRHFASDYPRFVWIREMEQCSGDFESLTSNEWKELIAARHEHQPTEAIGRNLDPLSHPEECSFNWAMAERTTFGVEASARACAEVRSDAGVRWALCEAQRQTWPLMILGGGSNILMHSDWPGLVMHMNIRGVEVIYEEGNVVHATVGAGENWHDWVMLATQNGWHGLENLALIPGSVGASPMQNIGAYGVELKDRFLWLEAINRETGALQRFDHEACQFGYRQSIFKAEERERWVIVRVAFALDRDAPLCTEYGAIQSELEAMGVAESATHFDVAQAVMNIRRSKLPDPNELGNAGSFFKNPVISREAFQKVLANHPKVVHYALESGQVKLAAGWLIEQAGWKGYRKGSCGVHDRQALVLVHYGGGTGAELWNLAQSIMEDVKQKFGVQLEPEVNQVGV
ncbi:MAG: UDP-N-acetylmuramate dehydrogenase [Flavobacteriales bacterium]